MAQFEPIRENIKLTRWADWVHIYRKDPRDPDFPVGTTAEVIVTKDDKIGSPILATWPAEDVNTDEISFWVQSEATDVIPDRSVYQLMVHYPPVVDGAEVQDWCWYQGGIRRTR
ncbi:hypothetical protein QNA24_30195 [Rhodococcus qingshengii]|uniref:LtfC-like domain-containing protein n=1 Tax=Rhodococcus TaxID=1827 RepID=UPI001E51F77C|nr:MULTISPECIES: hypothetical protein [Rhodococcus]MCD2099521.1 hypothetical protein [Rhodococcus rhodochrous]MCD2123889.1 hypothetical protein [Rhodococcus rhodochrous]MCQ4136684.1 hypothetical protein [Rhodococcus rhodochrous]MDJ0490655.1 hypothetical protein [Rhodococcus qingshengii]